MTPTWMPTQIIQRPLAELTPSPTNARTHSKAQIDALAQSIRSYGFPVPILIDGKGTIIAGHGRYAAAKKLKLKLVPTITADHLTDDHRRAYTIADNQLASMSEWDDEALKKEIAALTTANVDLTAIGLSPEQLQAMLDKLPTDTNEKKEKPTKRNYNLLAVTILKTLCSHIENETTPLNENTKKHGEELIATAAAFINNLEPGEGSLV